LKPHRNVELKARDPDPRRSLAACEALGAEPQGVLFQRDTYFPAPHGRLKLREEEGQVAAFRKVFEVDEADVIGGGYSDLLAQRLS
jgi:adenylate cyclase class IV